MRQPQRLGAAYDPRLDRFDVAIRAMAWMCRFSKRSWLRQMGVSGEELSQTQEAVATLNYPLRSEDGVFELLQRCPFLLDYALLLLVRYQARCLDGGVL